jgi:hypothetical protein
MEQVVVEMVNSLVGTNCRAPCVCALGRGWKTAAWWRWVQTCRESSTSRWPVTTKQWWLYSSFRHFTKQLVGKEKGFVVFSPWGVSLFKER